MLTAKLKELRKGNIGASEVPALFGEHIKLTGTDLWLKAAFGTDDVELTSSAIRIGEDFEKPLLGWAAKELNVEISVEPDDLFAVCEEHPILAATLDAKIKPFPSKEAIEAKTSSMDGDSGGKDNEWGEPGTDQIPNRVILQCQSQILCHGLDRVYVSALLGRMGLRRELYKIERNDAIISAIIQRAEEFWEKYIITKLQPPESLYGLGCIDVIKRIQRQPATWAEIDEALIFDWDAKRKARLEAEHAQDDALERMLTPLKDAEGVHLSDGRTLEYLPTTKSILDQKKFKAKQPELYEAFLKPSISRTPRLKGTINE